MEIVFFVAILIAVTAFKYLLKKNSLPESGFVINKETGKVYSYVENQNGFYELSDVEGNKHLTNKAVFRDNFERLKA